jgi:glycosyltransferase involved in cell wall biosynthesis
MIDTNESLAVDKQDIAFIIWDPFQWYVYKNVYKHLKDRSMFIVDTSMYGESEEGDEHLSRVVSLLEKNNVSYRIIRKEDFFLGTQITKLFLNIKLIVSVWERGVVTAKETKHILKVCVTYGAGKELTMVRPGRSIYDLILSYGERDTKLFSLSTTTRPIGVPKFDDFYNQTYEEISPEILKIDHCKKTVLYLPTHSDLGSFSIVAPKLLTMLSRYNVIVKLHNVLAVEEKESIEKMKQAGMCILSDEIDLLPLLNICDVAISDNSSAIFDVIQADKPLLVEDLVSEEYLSKDHGRMRIYKRGQEGALTYPDSIEQCIKREGKVVTNSDVQYLERDIETALKDEEVYKENRKAILKEIVAYTDGRCGERGARYIVDLLEGRLVSRKGILFYQNVLGKLLPEDALKISDKIEEVPPLETTSVIKKGDSDTYSIVVSLVSDNMFDIIGTLSSLMLQNIPTKKRIEIFIVGPLFDKKLENEVETLKEKNKTIKMLFVDAAHTHLSLGINRAVAMSTGDVIFFTESGCLLPKDWLLSITDTFKKYTNIQACGGSYIFPSHKKNKYGRLIKVFLENLTHSFVKNTIITNRYIDSQMFGSMKNVAYKRYVFEEIGFFDESIPWLHGEEFKIRFFSNRMRACLLEKDVISNIRINFFDFLKTFFRIGSFSFFMYQKYGQHYFYYKNIGMLATLSKIEVRLSTKVSLFTVILFKAALFFGRIRYSASRPPQPLDVYISKPNQNPLTTQYVNDETEVIHKSVFSVYNTRAFYFLMEKTLMPVSVETKKFSIVIPIFNRREYLPNLIKSLHEQGAHKTLFEVIVVDDGSEEDIESEVSRLSFLYTSLDIRYTRRENGGAAAARNTGAKIASGEFLIFIDSDVLPPSNLVQMYYVLWNFFPHMSCIGGGQVSGWDIARENMYARISNAATRNKSSSFFRISNDYKNSELYPIDTANISYRKDTFLSKGGFDESFGKRGAEDYDLALRTVLSKKSILWFPFFVFNVKRYDLVSTAKNRAPGHLYIEEKYHDKRLPFSFYLRYVKVAVFYKIIYVLLNVFSKNPTKDQTVYDLLILREVIDDAIKRFKKLDI